jgi:hypothetical protein
VPNQVLASGDYDVVMDRSRPLSQRLAAFARRADWDAPLGLDKSYTEQINSLVGDISQMGVVEVRDGLPDDPLFPPRMQVQQLPAGTAPRLAAAAPAPAGPRTDLSTIAKVRRFPRGLRP